MLSLPKPCVLSWNRRHADLVPLLHHRASLWYAQQNQTTQAILHALHAKAWDLVADLIERMRPQLSGLAWGISLRQLTVLHQCLKQLPPEIVGSRPLLCLACTKLLWTVASYPMQQAWLSTAETRLTASLTAHMPEVLAPEEQQEQRNLLGSVIGFRAMLQSYQEHAEAALPLCQQALSLVSADHVEARIHVALAQIWAYDYSVANDASAAEGKWPASRCPCSSYGRANAHYWYDRCSSDKAARNGEVE